MIIFQNDYVSMTYLICFRLTFYYTVRNALQLMLLPSYKYIFFLLMYYMCLASMIQTLLKRMEHV